MQSLTRYSALLSVSLLSSTVHAQDILFAQSGSNITMQSNSELYVEGNVTLADGSNLTNLGRFYVNRNTITGVADWLDQTNNSSSYSYGSGAVIFNSSGSQTAYSLNRFGTIEVRNGGLYLGSTIQSNNWLLHSGIIHTGTFMSVALSNAGLAVDATASNPNFTQSWFNGTLRRFIQPSSTNSYVFPVGSAIRVNRAELDNLTTNPINATYIDASFGPKPGTDAGLFLAGDGLLYTTVVNGGVWYLQPNVGSLSGQFDLRLYFNGFTGLADNLFGILQRPVPSSNGSDWIVPAGSNIPAVNQPGRMVTDDFARRNSVSILGQFGIATGNIVPLPITLLDFNAIRKNAQQVNLSWKTSSEELNASFHIERKTSTESNYRTVGTIPSTYDGSGHQEYHFTDPNADPGKSWYRLKMIEQTGKSTYSIIRIVNGISSSLSSITIAPNPNRGNFSIIAKGNTKTNQAFLSDAKGRLIKSFNVQENTTVQITGLSAGIYFLNIPNFFEDGTAFIEKIVVLH